MTPAALQEQGLLKLAQIDSAELLANARAIAEGRHRDAKANVLTWFVPPVTHALKGGVRTVFMLAEHFSRTCGTLNHVVVYSHTGVDFDTRKLSESLTRFFPGLRFVLHVHRRGQDSVQHLPASNAAFCTLWTTAYLLARYNRTSRKFYLMQDYEPAFYPAGSIYGAIEQTYRLGFSCIANTPGVGERYRRYSGDVVSFLPGVDTGLFRPDPDKVRPSNPRRVVFYGRPSNARNAFSLGLATMRALKSRMGDRVLIQSVGEAWDPADWDMAGIVENLGLLDSMEAVAELYRQADLGLVFMMTPHPSYQPLEYMASGCVVATNINEANAWLLNERNAVLLEPLPDVAADRIERLLDDAAKWSGKRDEGLQSIQRLRWDAAFKLVQERVVGPAQQSGA